jgi:cyclopropane-fatty-acyl-phospholipid synthase
LSKYIFPNSKLPSIAQIAEASENLLILEDLHNFGADYDKTLMAWQANFKRGWQQLYHQYDERFYRMWNYYLYLAAASFRARHIQLWQIVYSRHGLPGGYQVERSISAGKHSHITSP